MSSLDSPSPSTKQKEAFAMEMDQVLAELPQYS